MDNTNPPDTSVNKLVKQAENKPNNNPAGKGGFGDNPENINRKGRPPRGWAWSDIFEDFMDIIPEGASKNWKILVALAVLKECINGNMFAVNILFDRMEGKPKQKVDVTSAGEKLAVTTGEGAEAVVGLAQRIIDRQKQNEELDTRGS